LHEEFLYFQGQTTNACAFLLINGSLNEDKELNLTTNHRSPRAKRFVNYALKTRMEGVIVITGAGISKSGAYDKVVLLPMLVGTLYSNFG
jgi:hypothetical protein